MCYVFNLIEYKYGSEVPSGVELSDIGIPVGRLEISSRCISCLSNPLNQLLKRFETFDK